MAVVVFFLAGEFGEGFSEGGEVEDWIVAEAACAAWRFEYLAIGATTDDGNRAALQDQGNYAAEVCGAICRCLVRKFTQQFGVAFFAGGVRTRVAS